MALETWLAIAVLAGLVAVAVYTFSIRPSPREPAKSFAKQHSAEYKPMEWTTDPINAEFARIVGRPRARQRAVVAYPGPIGKRVFRLGGEPTRRTPITVAQVRIPADCGWVVLLHRDHPEGVRLRGERLTLGGTITEHFVLWTDDAARAKMVLQGGSGRVAGTFLDGWSIAWLRGHVFVWKHVALDPESARRALHIADRVRQSAPKSLRPQLGARDPGIDSRGAPAKPKRGL